jgi:DNA-binding PadR family transcriptional regulator
VELVGRGARRSKTYGLTDRGRAELRHWLVEAEPDRSQRNESGVRLFLTPLLEPADQRAAYQRDLAHVEDDLRWLQQLREQVRESDEPEAFAPQVELGIRIDTVILQWLQERLAGLPPVTRDAQPDGGAARTGSAARRGRGA